MPVISAIMPVYKTQEKFLRAAVESVLRQTFQDFELILIDDGSPDRCGEICDEYAAMDTRVIVLHQNNQGPSAARNTGMDHVRGQFLTFVDSDDMLVVDAWERVMRIFENPEVDCAVFGWVDIRPNGSEMMHPVTKDYYEISAVEATRRVASDNFSCGGGYPWNKFWRVVHLNHYSGHILSFNTQIYTYEDKLWVIEALEGLNKVALLPDILYEYREVESSLTHDAEGWARRQFNAYEAYDIICDKLRTTNRAAYEGAIGFYFGFCHKDMEITKEDRWRDEGRYRRTRQQLIMLCQNIHLGELHGLRTMLIWLYYWIIGVLFQVNRKTYMPDRCDAEVQRLHGRAFFIDVLRAIASFCVVWEHFGNEVHWYDASSVWNMCVPIQTLCFWAVPAFFMITGATCIPYRSRRSTLSFLKQRMLKIGIPYIIWALIALYANVYTGKLTLWGGEWGKLVSASHAVLMGRTEAIYWFFIPLFAIYLAMPILSLFSRSDNRPLLRYVIGVGTITLVVLPTVVNYLAVVGNTGLYWNDNWALTVVGGYSLYAITGYWLATHDFSVFQRKLCYISGVVCFALFIGSYYWLTPRVGSVPSILTDYMNGFVFGMALAIFVACRYIPWEKLLRAQILRRGISKMGECSFGVFILHIFVLRWMENQAIFGKYTPFWYFVCPIICYVFCMAVVYAAKKIPVLRRVFP